MSEEQKTEVKPPTTAIKKFDGNAIVSTQGTLKTLLKNDSIIQSLKDVCTKYLTPERLTGMVLSASSRNPLILKCTQGSILKSVKDAATLGLDCSGLLGRGYIVAYRNNKIGAYEAQFMTGYLGLCDLARRSGEVEMVKAEAVYEGDSFKYQEGTNEFLDHVPSLRKDAEKSKRTLLFVYAIATYRSGRKQFKVMTIPQVETLRNKSRAKDAGPWITDYVAMSLKTVVRQLCKFLPQSTELQEALALENELEANDLDIIKGNKESITQKMKDGITEPAMEVIDVDATVIDESTENGEQANV